ncbi:MAG: hypothetical protein M1150_01375 [Patescibacteria group bacterium]|nr:hypothetical protein [Patescibacteria group bacterium]
MATRFIKWLNGKLIRLASFSYEAEVEITTRKPPFCRNVQLACVGAESWFFQTKVGRGIDLILLVISLLGVVLIGYLAYMLIPKVVPQAEGFFIQIGFALGVLLGFRLLGFLLFDVIGGGIRWIFRNLAYRCPIRFED